jgi:hypothetical protein
VRSARLPIDEIARKLRCKINRSNDNDHGSHKIHPGTSIRGNQKNFLRLVCVYNCAGTRISSGRAISKHSEVRDTRNRRLSSLRRRTCLFRVCENVYTVSALNNNTLDLLFVPEIDVAPDPHSDECKCSDGSGRNTHVPLSDTKCRSDCVSSW